MELARILYSLLVSGANLVATGAVSEFAKGAGKAAFEALRKRLTEQHGVTSLSGLQDAKADPRLEMAVKAELGNPEIAADAEIVRLAEILRAEIAALPTETQSRYAIDIDTIRAGGALLVDGAEGVRASTATSQGDMTFRNIKAPPSGKA